MPSRDTMAYGVQEMSQRTTRRAEVLAIRISNLAVFLCLPKKKKEEKEEQFEDNIIINGKMRLFKLACEKRQSITALSSIMTLLMMADRSVRDLNSSFLTRYNWILSDIAEDG